jgi:hypothetical protein
MIFWTLNLLIIWLIVVVMVDIGGAATQNGTVIPQWVLTPYRYAW